MELTSTHYGYILYYIPNEILFPGRDRAGLRLTILDRGKIKGNNLNL